MTTAIDHRLITLLTAAARHIPAGSAGGVEVVGRPPGVCSAVVALAGHAVIAADVSEGWVRRYLPAGSADEHEYHPALSSHFLAALSEQLGVPPAGLSVLLAAAGPLAAPAGQLTPVTDDPLDWSEFRVDVHSYRYRGCTGSGSISVGRGPAGRWDARIDLDRSHQRSSEVVRGRELLRAARALIPAGAPLFVSVPVHAGRSLRTAMSAGFEPLGAEVLFPTDDADHLSRWDEVDALRGGCPPLPPAPHF